MVIFSLLPNIKLELRHQCSSNIRACDLLQDPLLDAIIPYFKDFTLTDTCLCLLTKITLPPLPLALLYSITAEFEPSKSTYSSYIAAQVLAYMYVAAYMQQLANMMG